MSEQRKYTVAEIARRRGVSERAVYKQIKTHEAKLAGHIEKIQGKQWLDEYAVNLLDEAASNSAPVVVEDLKQGEFDALKEENERLKRELDEDRSALRRATESMAELIKQHNENATLIAESKLYIEQRDNAQKQLEEKDWLYNAEKERADELHLKLQEAQMRHEQELATEKERKLTLADLSRFFKKGSGR